MANGLGATPWVTGVAPNLGRYANLLYRDRYLSIDGFLRDERAVQEGLTRLQTATQGRDQMAFRAYLAEEEQRFGFSAQLGVITAADDLIKASRFWLFLMRRQALVDIGAGDDDHGVLIHRVQWALVGQWNDRMGGVLGPTSAIAELYANLGGANARLLTKDAKTQIDAGAKLNTGAKGYRVFDSVWDDVFDATGRISNATKPEYLRAYIEARFGGLNARMRW